MIEVRNLEKRFGDLSVLKGISFTAHDGMVTGFVGPNGAGKSTTMKIIAGLEQGDSGLALVDGVPFDEVKKPGIALGIHFSGEPFPENMTAEAILAYVASLVGAPSSRGDELLEMVGLADAKKREAARFSMGMRQRLGIAVALMGDPQNVMLDEPVNGLDPLGVAWVRDLLRSLADSGKAVLLSSHLMSELELVADDVVMLDEGVIVAAGSTRELHRSSRSIVRVQTRQPQDVAAVLKTAGYQVHMSDNDVIDVHQAEAEDVGRVVFAAGLPLHSLTTYENTLEQTFIELTRKEGAQADDN